MRAADILPLNEYLQNNSDTLASTNTSRAEGIFGSGTVEGVDKMTCNASTRGSKWMSECDRAATEVSFIVIQTEFLININLYDIS